MIELSFSPVRIMRPDAALCGDVFGAGPAVLLLHAGGERRRVWLPVVAALVAAGYRCTVFDQRGHGESTGDAATFEPFVADTAAMIAAQPQGCIVVGASLGGLAAIGALADPAIRARVSGLVLVDVVANLDPGRARRFLASIEAYRTHGGFVEDILAQIPGLHDTTTGLDLPILLIRGGTDSPLTDDDVDGLLSAHPDTSVTRVAGAGHLVARDRPIPLAQAIIEGVADWAPQALLRELGANDIDHPGGSLLDHLHRVRDLVVAWGGSPRVRVAALCHAVYGTDGFRRPLLRLDERHHLRAAIGSSAEELVYCYAACDRAATYPRLGTSPLLLTDRFSGDTVTVADTDLTDFALLTVANELDVARFAALNAATRDNIRALIAALDAYIPDITVRALSDMSLT